MVEQWLLAVETSDARGGVALARGGDVAAARPLSADRRYTSELFPVIRDLLAEAGLRPANLDIFCYSSGPGSFTGLRIAATVGRMLQSAVGCRVVAVPTLEVIARNVLVHPARPARVAAILDAKRGQVYGAAFERQSGADAPDDFKTIIPAGLYDAGPWLADLEKPFWILGAGVALHADACAASGGQVLEEAYWTPTAEQVVAIGARLAAAGKFCKPEEITPLYLRRPEAEEVYEQRRIEARRRRGE